MIRDNDLIRGVGYMVIQASHLEKKIEDICCWLNMGFTRPEHHTTRRVSDKIKWCKLKIKELDNPILSALDKSLDKAANLLQERNKLVHGQIYFASNMPEKIVSSSMKDKDKEILPSKVYDLAESMYKLHQKILSENSFRLVSSLKGRTMPNR